MDFEYETNMLLYEILIVVDHCSGMLEWSVQYLKFEGRASPFGYSRPLLSSRAELRGLTGDPYKLPEDGGWSLLLGATEAILSFPI